MQGIVLKSTGSWYNVLSEGAVFACRIKGKFRNQNIQSTNPVAVGDRVSFYIEPSQESGIITEILPRQNYIVRKSVNLSKQTHILASNIDLLLIVATINHPKTSTGFIDRLLLSAYLFNIQPIIVFNKVDLYSQEEKSYLDYLSGVYQSLNITIFTTSTLFPESLVSLSLALHQKTVLLAGHSGVGKSSLINQLFLSLRLKVSEISEWSNKGKHTTTFAEMFACENGSFIIDSPGIKEMGMTEVEPNDMCNYYPDFTAISSQCKFYNCKHINEPHCAVIKALEGGSIAPFRYSNYVGMYQGLDTRK